MVDVVADWGRFLRQVSAPENVSHQVTLEIAEVTLDSPPTIRHRGVVSSAGVTVSPHVGALSPGPCLVAVLSGESNLTTGLRVIIGMI